MSLIILWCYYHSEPRQPVETGLRACTRGLVLISSSKVLKNQHFGFSRTNILDLHLGLTTGKVAWTKRKYSSAYHAKPFYKCLQNMIFFKERERRSPKFHRKSDLNYYITEIQGWEALAIQVSKAHPALLHSEPWDRSASEIRVVPSVPYNLHIMGWNYMSCCTLNLEFPSLCEGFQLASWFSLSIFLAGF